MRRLVPDNRVVCLDWDSRRLRVVLAKCGKKEVRILQVASEPIPADVQGADELGELVREVLNRAGIRATRCVVDIPRDQAVLNTLIVVKKRPRRV